MSFIVILRFHSLSLVVQTPHHSLLPVNLTHASTRAILCIQSAFCHLCLDIPSRDHAVRPKPLEIPLQLPHETLQTTHPNNEEPQLLAIDIEHFPPRTLGHLGADLGVPRGAVDGGDGQRVGLVRQVQHLRGQEGRVEVCDDAPRDARPRGITAEVERLEICHGEAVRESYVRVEAEDVQHSRLDAHHAPSEGVEFSV